MKSRERRSVDIFSMSFLDVVSCGFGAIILLLVIVKVAEPMVVEKISTDLSGLVQKRSVELEEVRAESLALDRELREDQARLVEVRERLADLKAELLRMQRVRDGKSLALETQSIIERQLEAARQSLSEEQKRLLGASYRRPQEDATIGGIPVDSEYVIFIIDTSGSMQRFAWPLVNRKVAEVLKIYPRVKAIQVMNDMGDYMFSQYAGKWIPDTPARRRSILKRLTSWTPFSNSSPVEGIEAAIGRFYAPDKKISLYIFGDDFSRGSIETVVNTVDRLNKRGKRGDRRVRIHAVGFPVLFQHADNPASAVRFAALMRKLAETNGGSFVGLNSTSR
jgi:hypothetical protein